MFYILFFTLSVRNPVLTQHVLIQSSHISNAQKPHLASGYCIRQHRSRHLPRSLPTKPRPLGESPAILTWLLTPGLSLQHQWPPCGHIPGGPLWAGGSLAAPAAGPDRCSQGAALWAASPAPQAACQQPSSLSQPPEGQFWSDFYGLVCIQVTSGRSTCHRWLGLAKTSYQMQQEAAFQAREGSCRLSPVSQPLSLGPFSPRGCPEAIP